MGQGGNTHGDSDCRDALNTEPLTRCEDTQAGHSRDATAMATAFEPLNRSLETFLTRLSRTNERSEKSRRVFKKPRCYKDESDGCIDTWIEARKLHFEEEDLLERQECSALTSNLKGTALNCVMAKKQYQRDTAKKFFEILLNRFGSGVQGHQAMMRFEKRRQREDETIDKFLDDLEMLRRRSQPDESNRRMNLAVASKFIDGVKNDEFRTMLATHYTPLSTNAPTPEELRLKSKEYLLLKPPSRSGYYKNNYGNFNNGPANPGNNWYKPRDDMDKRRSCANYSSTGHHVPACPTYKQGMKAIGFSLEDEDASELDHEYFMRGVIAKFGPRCFFCNLEGHFISDCPQFWDAVADIKHPRHEEALSGVKASKARLLSEAEARRKDKPQELATKKMQAVTEETREPEPVTAADDFKIDYRAALRDALNRVQQELVTKEIQQKMKLELENEKLQEQLNTFEATKVEETKASSSLSMNCVMAKKQYQRDTAEKIFEILLNRFGSGVQGHQAMMRFEKRRQREDETIDKFLDDLEMLRRRSQPDESNRRMNLAVASKFIDGVKNDELRTMLATHYTPLSTNAPTPKELRLKSKEYLLLKPPSRSGYYKNNYGNFNNGPANQGNNWYKPRDDMDKRRSCANCSSTDHHVLACPTYKQGMKAIGFSLEDEDASKLDHEYFMRGVIAKFGPRCFFCNLEGHFISDCPQFWDAVADIKHPRHEEALSGVKASKARLLSEAEACRKDKPQELATKKMQAVTEETREPEPVTAADDFKIDYRAALRDALNRVQQELVTKEIQQKVKLELENEKLQEQLNTFEATEVEETKAPSSLSMKLNVISGQRFGMVPQESKILSIISVAGHQVIRNLSEPSEFTLMHLDTYADYLRQVEPRTESRAVRALLTTGGPRTKKLHGRYLEVYGPYQVMLNVDGISIYTRTYVTTDSDQIGQIYLGEEELKVRRIGHDTMMEQDAVHIGYEADVTAHLLDTNGPKIGVTGLLDTGAVVSVMPIKTLERMGRSDSNESPTGRRQSRGDLRSRKNADNISPHGRTRSMDDLPGSREFRRRRPIHLGQRFCQEF